MNKFGTLYVATCRVNGKQYVGKTVRKFKYRKSAHKHAAEIGLEGKFYNAIRKHGFDSFDWIEQLIPVDQLLNAEMNVIAQLDTFRNGYNASTGGEAPHFSEETRRKQSIVRMGKKASKQARNKLSLALRGRHHSEEHIAKVAASNRGQKRSAASRLKMSLAHLGKKLSAFHRRRISEGQTGRKLSDSWKESMSKARFGKHYRKRSK